MHQIKASEIKPGMTIEWSELGIKYTCVVSSIEPACSQISQEIMASGGGEATLYSNTMVTVLAEPRPEEPTEFGARVTVDGLHFVRADDDDTPWKREGESPWWHWNDLWELGPVIVVPDQGWTVPDDTPEMPDRIEVWPEDDEALRGYKWRDRDGDIWEARGNQWICNLVTYAPVTRPSYGPWTRVTDA